MLTKIRITLKKPSVSSIAGIDSSSIIQTYERLIKTYYETYQHLLESAARV